MGCSSSAADAENGAHGDVAGGSDGGSVDGSDGGADGSDGGIDGSVPGTCASDWPVTIPCIPGRTFDPNEPLVTPVGSGTIYYLDGSAGADSNDGRSRQTAFATIQRGLNALSAGGDTVLIKPGLYRERPLSPLG